MAKFLIIVPPLRAKATYYPPFGALYIASALRSAGHHVQMLNVDVERIGMPEVMKRLHSFSPDIVGITGIVSTIYKYIKEISQIIKKELPGIKIILGGSISAAAEIVLKNTVIDVVVKGEGEVTINELTPCLLNSGDLSKVNGIMFRDGNNNIVQTPPREQIKDIDELPYPAIDLLDMNHYLVDPLDYIKGFREAGYEDVDPRFFEPHRRGKKQMVVHTARGCTNRCTFCQRHMKGIRVNSFDYLLKYLEYLMDKYNVGFFSLGAELFLPSKKLYREFLEEIKKRKLDFLYFITGARVNTVDKEILQGLKETGCWMIEYGFESGSQKMLDIMEKGVTVEQNVQAVKWTMEAGLYTVPGIIIGMPGEAPSTVKESIDALKSLNLNWHQTYCNFPLALPGSPLYEYAVLNGLVTDGDKYLEQVSDVDATLLVHKKGSGSGFVNYTEYPDDVVKGWKVRVIKELEMHYIKNKLKGNFLVNYFKFMIMRRIKTVLAILDREGFGKWLAFVFKRVLLLLIVKRIFKTDRKDNEIKVVETGRKIIPENVQINNDGKEIVRSISLRKIIKNMSDKDKETVTVA